MLPRHYTTAEVAESLRVSVDYLCDQVKRGLVSPLRMGDSPTAPMRWSDDDVARLIAALKPVEAPTTRRRRRRAS